MDTPLTLVTSDVIERKPKPIVHSLRELAVTDEMLFRGTDERGQSGWFCRLTVGGLFPRRIGPYRTKSEASEVLEDFIEEIRIELFLNLMNDVSGTPQVFVVEGVPMLNGRPS